MEQINKIKLNTQKIINTLGKNIYISYTEYNSNKPLKMVVDNIFNKIDITSNYTDTNGFNIMVKIKNDIFKMFLNNQNVIVSKNAEMQVNPFASIFKADFVELIKNANIDFCKKVLSETICYSLRKANKLKNAIKYYNDNNLKISLIDIMQVVKLSPYTTLKQFAFDFITALEKQKTNNV